jgi:transcription elongation factor SPT6
MSIEDWLNTYTEANPKRSMYAFCINPKYPGYFWLLIKEGLNARLIMMNVKVIPNGFKLNEASYPDMRSLRNGMKLQLDALRKGAQHKGRM